MSHILSHSEDTDLILLVVFLIKVFQLLVWQQVTLLLSHEVSLFEYVKVDIICIFVILIDFFSASSACLSWLVLWLWVLNVYLVLGTFLFWRFLWLNWWPPSSIRHRRAILSMTLFRDTSLLIRSDLVNRCIVSSLGRFLIAMKWFGRCFIQ